MMNTNWPIAQGLLATYATLYALRYAWFLAVDRSACQIAEKQFLVTGACGALGKHICEKLVKNGAHTIILWDVQGQELEKFSKQLLQLSPKVRVLTKKVNLGNREQLVQAIEELNSDRSVDLDVFVNNAGIVFCGETTTKVSDDEDELMMRVNFLAQAIIVKKIVPFFETKGKGHIVCVASSAAFVGGAGMATYCASKAALKVFLEGVSAELLARFSPVTISIFCPGSFQSKLFEGFEFPFVPLEPAESIADSLINDCIFYRRQITIYPYRYASIPFLSGIANAFGRLLLMPKSPVVNWKGRSYVASLKE